LDALGQAIVITSKMGYDMLAEEPEGLLDEAVGMPFQHLGDRAAAQTTGITRVAVVERPLRLVTADGDLVGVDDDDEVTAVDVGRERRLVLAAQQIGSCHGEPAEPHVGGVDDVPRTRGVTRLRRVRRHSAYLFLLLGWIPE